MMSVYSRCTITGCIQNKLSVMIEEYSQMEQVSLDLPCDLYSMKSFHLWIQALLGESCVCMVRTRNIGGVHGKHCSHMHLYCKQSLK